MSMLFLHPAPFLRVTDVEVNPLDPTPTGVAFCMGGGREKVLALAAWY